MRTNLSVLSLLLLLAVLPVGAQNTKKPLSWDDIESWRRITETVISPDGSFIAYKTEPWKGDAVIKVYDRKGIERASWTSVTGIRFTNDSKFLIFTIKPGYDQLRELKQKKAKREEMPGDTLAIWSVAKGTLDKIPAIRSFRLPSKWAGWMAYQTEPVSSGSREPNREEARTKKESATNGYKLTFRNMNTGAMITFPFVTQYDFFPETSMAYFVTSGDDDAFKPGIYVYDFAKEEHRTVATGKGNYRQVVFNKDASGVAFLFNDTEPDKSGNNYSLWYGPLSGTVSEVVTKELLDAPDDWIISESGRVSFSDSGSRLFFTTSPPGRQRDTTRLDEDIPVVDIWHWNEGALHTQQVLNKSRDARRSFQAVYNIANRTVRQLATPDMPDITLIKSGDYDLALGVSDIPYQVESMWESTPGRNDVYIVNLIDGSSKLLKQGFRGRLQPSQDGKYLTWFTASDSSWYTIRLSDMNERKITDPRIIKAANETNDVPNPPGSYSFAGWLRDDRYVLLYDRFDIWKVDPDGAEAPVRITTNGRETKTVYRLVRLDRDREGLDPAASLFLSGVNEVTRAEGYYTLSLLKPGVPSPLLTGNFSLGTPQKAENGNTIIFSKETFEEFPDLFLTDTDFRKPVRISDANPQQKGFLWGTAELVSWTSLDGRPVEGLLFKPENFDPSRKYPMIVNFYEKSSQGLYSYRNPEHHRSTIDYHYYTSNGYLVFNPDIYYIDGYPGESAFNCIMPGITHLVSKGYVDIGKIGAQGHSWGGYQVAYLATRTSMFAAIESGAPVVNMFSAYGGIRWESGLSRSFQYEHQQSRIGASIWEEPLRYFENSPLFTMDKVTTPILIMANDQDGAVPWYQGIEYFIALRRLGKPAWLLNYTGEPHWPQKPQNKKDFQIRMSQFFDHYLKGKPMPLWMSKGIPAVDRDYELGYGYR